MPAQPPLTADGVAVTVAPQAGLFVLWPNSRAEEPRILADLGERFELRAVYEVRWSRGRFAASYERFYSDLEVRGVYHVHNKGTGPFLAAVLVDRTPALEPRMTSRGRRTVNARFVDAKSTYREWLGGLGVHCGETAWETDRDLTMLLGRELKDRLLQPGAAAWDGRVESLRADLSGTGGWPSAAELFAALNAGADYVVLDGPGGAPFTAPGAEPQILAGQYHAVHTVLGARAHAWWPPAWGGRFRVTVGGRRLAFGLRLPGDGFLDEGFARGCLERRVLDDAGHYRLRPLDAFAVAVHRELHHAARSDPDRRRQLAAAAREHGLEGWTPELFDDRTQAQQRLIAIAEGHGPGGPDPRDPLVRAAAAGGRLRRVAAACRVGAAGLLRFCHLRLRDRLLLAAPWLRRMRSLLRRRRRDLAEADAP